MTYRSELVDWIKILKRCVTVYMCGLVKSDNRRAPTRDNTSEMVEGGSELRKKVQRRRRLSLQIRIGWLDS